MRGKIFLFIIVVLFIVSSTGISRAADETLWTTSVEPDALMVLDLSGSMAWLPHGSNPTFYSCGDSCNSPYYADPVVRGTPANLYTTAGNCTNDGPYTITQPLGWGAMPTSNLWVAGTDCNSNGPFYLTAPSDRLTPPGNNLYISTSSNCSTFGGPFYKSSGSGHTRSCSISTYIPDTVYSSSDCSNGTFYKTSGSGHTTVCKKYKQCSAFTPGYTASTCPVGPYYRTSGTGHNYGCVTLATCPTPAIVYSETDCTTGPFWNTSGSGHTTVCQNCNRSCSVNGTNYRYSDTATCEGPFSSSSTGTTDCSKIQIAKRAIFQLFDDTNDSNITSTDVTSLGMRVGFMRYYDCDAQDHDPSNDTSATPWTSGCIQLSWSMTQSDNNTATPYANVFCNNSTCAAGVSSCSISNPQKECVAGYGKTGGTPIGDALFEAKQFMSYHKTLDAAATCRQKSIILITDGEDTFSCPGSGGQNCGMGSTTCAAQRRAPIYWAKKAKDAGYKVYVVGFGADMPASLQDTLNWAAYYGGTRNPNATQTGSTSAVTVGTDPCSNGTDPQGQTLRGYAFMASNPDELVNSIRTALSMILEANYSFSAQASVAAARVQEENYIYEVSFEPKNNSGASKEPFWTGHVKKYQIGDSGSIITPRCWDAGEQLKVTEASDRSMWTYKNGAVTLFNTGNITAADLGITGSTTQTVESVVGFYRGEAAYNLELSDGNVWKLGDLFHTNPVAVKTPTEFFFDPRECGATSYTSYRQGHIRLAANGNQILIAGANDGQLHAFRTGNGADCASGGEEMWSFIPPNLLQKIAPIAHYSHADRSSLSSHDYFIDGPIQVSDVWLPSTASSGTTKSAGDWKTIVTFGEGQGSGSYLWSHSSNCYSNSTSDFSGTYDAANYPYYCGLYAINVTNSISTAPAYMWHLMPSSSQAPYLGQAWSKMQTGRIKIGDNEKWVGFVGGGYSAASCLSVDGTTSTACNTPATGSAGKGFFVVDLTNGSILWSYTHVDNPNMDFSTPASPLPLDIDGDQFIDTVYMGDLGGNMWRFRLCPKDPLCSECGRASYTSSPCTSCGTGNWTGSRLFASTNVERGSGMGTATNTHKQIFALAQATYDENHNLWIFFGTGENNDPTYKPTIADPDTDSTKNRLYAIKEDLPDFAATYTSANLTNITSSVYADSDTKHGWYINLSTGTLIRSDNTAIINPKGEKMISDPAIFGGMVYFATYVPDQGASSACGAAGDAFMYKLNYQTGAGSTAYMGHGIGSSILVSYGPGYSSADIYATASGGAGTGSLTQTLGKAPQGSSMTNVLYWRDRRLK